VLQLPIPSADDIDRVVWDVDDGLIRQQYRRLSVYSHPDKNAQSSPSKEAFAKLHASFSCMSDSADREAYVKQFVDDLIASRPRGWAPFRSVTATLQQRQKVRPREEQVRDRTASKIQASASAVVRGKLYAAKARKAEIAVSAASQRSVALLQFADESKTASVSAPRDQPAAAHMAAGSDEDDEQSETLRHSRQLFLRKKRTRLF